jgi:hypothetical protein
VDAYKCPRCCHLCDTVERCLMRSAVFLAFRCDGGGDAVDDAGCGRLGLVLKYSPQVKPHPAPLPPPAPRAPSAVPPCQLWPVLLAPGASVPRQW